MSRSRVRLGAAVVLVVMGAAVADAQWPGVAPRGLPRTTDGRIDLGAPPPRAADGRPDLSGVWEPEPDPAGRAGGVEGGVLPRYMLDITIDQKPGEVPFQPWAAALFKQRTDRALVDNPRIRCLPTGVPGLVAYTLPYKIFMDGRAHLVDPEPTWMGYSVGHWEGDDLVVDTRGFNDQSWLDGTGHPHSTQMRVIERYTRRTVGQMDVSVSIDDPGAYTRPLTYTQRVLMRPGTELIEYVCENAKPMGNARK